MLTVVGRIRLVRRWYSGGEVGSVAPVDEQLDRQQATVSVGVREMACRLNNDCASFDTAAANLHRTALVRVSGEQLRRLVLHEGQAVLEAQRTNAVPPAFRATECVVDPSLPEEQQTTRLYGGLDGVMVPVITEAEKVKRRRKTLEKRRRCGKKRPPLPPRRTGSDESFKEFKTVAFYDESRDRWHEALSRRPRKQMGALVRREARRLGQKSVDETVALVDGAPWIRTQLEERPDELRLDGLGLDFYHLAENVHRCARAVLGEDEKTREAWAGPLLHAFRHEGCDAAWDRLTAWRATLRNRAHKQAADRLLHYVGERRDMIQYPEFSAKGWQIGSGPTESRCKTSTARLKGRGRRWDPRNAEAVAALTTLRDSDQWRLYWPTSTQTKTSPRQ